MVIKKDFKYLGIIRANPVEYVQRYGSTLKTTRELPDFVLDIKPPAGVVLAADYQYNQVHELEGDLHAMRLVDLEREGLAEYRPQLQRLGINYLGPSGVASELNALASQSQTLASQSNVAASQSNHLGSPSNGAISQSNINSILGLSNPSTPYSPQYTQSQQSNYYPTSPGVIVSQPQYPPTGYQYGMGQSLYSYHQPSTVYPSTFLIFIDFNLTINESF